jgi:hypothetical protein
MPNEGPKRRQAAALATPKLGATNIQTLKAQKDQSGVSAASKPHTQKALESDTGLLPDFDLFFGGKKPGGPPRLTLPDDCRQSGKSSILPNAGGNLR